MPKISLAPTDFGIDISDSVQPKVTQVLPVF